MAKGQRMMLGFTCGVCKQLNYLTQKNKTNTPDKMTLRKYCRFCKKATEHKESTRFK